MKLISIFINVLSRIVLILIIAFTISWSANTAVAQSEETLSGNTEIIPVAEGWARNSINTVIFRTNSVTTFQNKQYTAFYDSDGNVMAAKRERGKKEWEINKTGLQADVEDAHNSISIAVDGNGLLHLSWGMHGQEILYAQGKKPGSLEFDRQPTMTGKNEEAVTYPQFYRLPDGDLLFMYREGSSGRGNVMVNRYNIEDKEWKAIQHPLIDGEGERNAYVNGIAIDEKGGWHLSWTWRESWDVATNHDIMYAYSPDEGNSWETSKGERYVLPITLDNAEIAYKIPQGSELINQTSMTVNSEGNPVIASYWKGQNDDAPQFYVVWNNGEEWKKEKVGNRTLDFSLSGGGTKRIPISRPQIIAGEKGKVHLIFRDFERGGGISIAASEGSDYSKWSVNDIYQESVGLWEPTLDSQAWKKHRELYLFVQNVGQGDGETLEDIAPQEIFLLKWRP
ncbi:BNR repeat-containing protein [Aliifodinibius salicampi]|uniref:BNR repeat-containing protein n=1 Tax=Fodinibius salicampi TaxID=1920655 RepID=A0ABT3PVI4_9BACT|nr:BNR repeat-containing protein [Fodinibius salicampi]